MSAVRHWRSTKKSNDVSNKAKAKSRFTRRFGSTRKLKSEKRMITEASEQTILEDSRSEYDDSDEDNRTGGPDTSVEDQEAVHPIVAAFDAHSEELNYNVLQEQLKVWFTQDDFIGKINGATAVLNALCELEAAVGSRKDILVFSFRAYHVRVEHEIGPLLNLYQDLDIPELLRLLDMINAYEQFTRKLIEDELRSQLPPNSMFSYVEKLVSVYQSKLESTMNTWASNIAKANLSGLAELRNNHESSMVYTNAPIDLFKVVSEAIGVAKEVKDSQIEASAIRCSISALNVYAEALSRKLQSEGADINHLCAFVNDCGVIIDHIETLNVPTNFDNEALEALCTKFNETALLAVSRLVRLIEDDLLELSELLFSKGHLDAVYFQTPTDVVARMSATICDYFSDLQECLDQTYFHKLAKLLSRWLVLTYCKRLLSIKRKKRRLRSSRTQRLTSKQIRRIAEDRNILFEAVTSPFKPITNPQLAFPEFNLIDHLLEFLTISASGVVTRVTAICELQRDVSPYIKHIAKICISMRKDLLKADSKGATTSLSSHGKADVGVGSSVTSQMYEQVFISLDISLDTDAAQSPQIAAGKEHRHRRLSVSVQHGLKSVVPRRIRDVARKLKRADDQKRKDAFQEEYATQENRIVYGNEVLDRKGASMEALVDRVVSEERRRVGMSLSVSTLKEACKEVNLDTSQLLTREQIVDVLEQQGICPDHDALVRQLLNKTSIQETDPEFSSKIFEYAVREATLSGSKVLEAKAFSALGGSYTKIPAKTQAAPMILQMAAELFWSQRLYGEFDSCTLQAAASFHASGQTDAGLSLLRAAQRQSSAITQMISELEKCIPR